MKHLISILVMATLALGELAAQTISFSAYIDTVRRHNIALAAQQYNLSIGEADVAAARATDDPTLSVGYDNNSDWGIAMGQSASAEISKAFSPGKLSARVAVAKSALELSRAEYDDFWRNLKADATIDFCDALLSKELLNIGRNAYLNIEALAQSDSIRFSKGEISELDMLQSRLEQRRAQQELNSRRTDYLNALILIDERCGLVTSTSDLEGSLAAPTQLYTLSYLIDQAYLNRPDLRASVCAETLLDREEKLALRERRSDLEFSLGANYNTQVRNEEAPAPEFVGYSVGLSIPLPFTSVNQGVRKASQLRVSQAATETEALRATIRAEVTRAYNNYQAAIERAKVYGDDMMSNAQVVLDGKLYAYRRGDTSLLEVLTAQHTFNEIQEEYASCLHDCMVALAELERCTGM